MTLNDAETLTNSLLQQHAPNHWRQGWRFGSFLPPGRTLGNTDYGIKRINLSRNYVLKATESDVRDVILHEVAHVLAGRNVAAHGPVWRAYALSVGAHPRACKDASSVDLGTRYVGKCPHGCIINYQRRPGARTLAHGRCHTHRSSILWKDTRTGLPLST